MDLERDVAALAPGLLRYCRGRTGDPALAEELAQDALATLVERCRRGSPPRCPAAFVFAVARRRAGRAVVRRALAAPLEALGLGPADREPGPERRVADRERLGQAVAAIRALSRADRESLLLVVAGGLDLTAASVVLGISVSALKMRLSRARGRLHRLLEARHGSEPRSDRPLARERARPEPGSG